MDAEYTQQYSGFIGQTFNYEYRDGNGAVVPTTDFRDSVFQGIHPEVRRLARLRIQKRPDEYNNQDAVMTDVTRYYT